MTARRNNAFDLLRLFAALAVLYSHSFPLYGLEEPTILGKTVGTLAVAIFFAASGYLVTNSWNADKNINRFLQRRALRIFPGLAVAVIFTTFFAGAIDTNVTLSQYLTDTRTYAYLLNNLFLFASIPAPPGAFAGLPLEGANGSLWTLRYEVLMYLLLLALGVSRRLKALAPLAFGVCVIAWLTLEYSHQSTHLLKLPFLWRYGLYFDLHRIAFLGAYFFGGSILSL